MSAFPAVPEDTKARQRRASHPRNSAWVAANAGSGKTFVLTQRVVRLLLEGVPPARILCLTFTKAAAANMSIRVFETLAAWTTLDDTALTAAIEDMGAGRPSPAGLTEARKLFARTVETPGGLKIQTIHAFCERLLHLFPFEANVPARFEVLDDLMAADLLEQARAAALTEAVEQPETPLGRAVAFLAQDSTAASFETLLREALSHRGRAATAGGSHVGGLANALGLGEDDNPSTLRRVMLEEGLPLREWAALAQRLGADGTGADTAGNRLAQAAVATEEERLERYLAVFFTAKGLPRADRYLPAALRKKDPALAARFDSERGRLIGLFARRLAAQTHERTLALLTVARAVLTRYDGAKGFRGLLDFDDLVAKTRSLLTTTGAAWVLFKLDGGIDHVLVDEAQDTAPAQWDILRALTAEFFAGAGQARVRRTFFAVGDEKQSIYSFQGARPAMFDAMRRRFASEARGGDADFEDVRLNLSFRSAPAILAAVDRIFSIPAHARGLSADETAALPHVALKQRLPGLVQLWPAVGPTPISEPRDWRLPLDQVDPQSPPVVVAQRVAATIAALVVPGSEDTVADGEGRRPVRAGDIMILVRTRNAFFEAVIRALKDRNVPVAGADRIELTEHIAVMDLMAAGRAALLPEDDLSVACVLKSPLIGLDDDDLIALAPGRTRRLIDELAHSTELRHVAAAAKLASWRSRASTLSPFGFYARLLGADGGRKALLARLGTEAGDAIDEFLALTLVHEREGPPSLLAFLSRLEQEDLSIKRDMEAAGDAVRVMTVHAAKGLEAKIVFLPDTCGAPSGRHDPKLFVLDDRDDPTSGHLAWSPRVELDPPPVATARAALRQAAVEEHNRLLYVALTRAEERLYIGGFHGPRGLPDGCWYAMIASSGLDLVDAPASWDAAITIREHADPGLRAGAARADPPIPANPPPDWLFSRPAREIVYAPPVRPSNALAAADQQSLAPEGFDADRDDRRRNAALAGRLAHRLLQHLPAVSPERRRDVAIALLQGQGLDQARQTALVDDVLRLLAAPNLRDLFGPSSRAEVGLAGRVQLASGQSVEIVGQLDRVAVTAAAVLIADFKTGRPHDLTTVQAAYVTQLALYRAAVAPLYPGLPVRAFLVWTTGPAVLELPAERLDKALAELASAQASEGEY